jgi:hypothetical protein
VYALLQRPEPCLHHGQRVVELCEENGIGDFDLAFGYEACARAHAIAGEPRRARSLAERALRAPEDRELLPDLLTVPGLDRFW